jgi:hypothetical protein
MFGGSKTVKKDGAADLDGGGRNGVVPFLATLAPDSGLMSVVGMLRQLREGTPFRKTLFDRPIFVRH